MAVRNYPCRYKIYTKKEIDTLLENIDIDPTDYYTKSEVDGLIEDKQDVLTAGTGITIDSDNVISASGGGNGLKWVNQTKENYRKFFNLIDGATCLVLHDCIMTDDKGNVLFMLYKGQNTQPNGHSISHNEIGDGGQSNLVIGNGNIKYRRYMIGQSFDFIGVRYATYSISATTTEDSGNYTTTFSIGTGSNIDYTAGKIYYWDEIDFSS